MLQPIEQAVLAQCGVFRAPFNLDDAEAVVDLSAWSDVPDLATILDVLVENSLIKLTGELEDGRRHRLTLYRNVRAFVAGKMGRRGSLGLMAPAEVPVIMGKGCRVSLGRISATARSTPTW